MRKRRVRIEESKLGRHRAWGIYLPSQKGLRTPKIIIDPRQKPKDEMDTIIHEGLHHAIPSLSEKQVMRAASDLTEILWNMNYRRTRQ